MLKALLAARLPSVRRLLGVLALASLLSPGTALASPGAAEPELDVTADTPAARLAARRTLSAGVAFGGPAASLAPLHRRPNALVSSTSPYLQQHAWNPVEWQPWGEAAFEQARREKKLIFLSVGYSTCHWCHVMEHETFESFTVAAELAESFVCIKLDREERPDVDAFYMKALQAMTGGHGGWPMSMFLTPERRPFFGRTYLPREVFLRLLGELDRTWRAEPETAQQAGRRLTDFVRKQTERHAAPGKLSPALAAAGVKEVASVFDPVHGGFGRRGPKFPRPMTFGFLLRMAARRGSPGALANTRKTLDAMAAGGIHDQLGGGFHRYSTDRTWTLPHFEKMLYDNGLLAVLYLEAWQLTGRQGYREVARRTARWIERRMAVSGGGFASATDADTAGVEGATFLWTEAEIRSALGEDAAREFFAVFKISAVGGVPERPEKGVLERGSPVPAAAKRLKIEPGELRRRLDRHRRTLLARRDRRAQPSRDDKLLTAWNGLAISALARVGAACRDEALIHAAERAADRILREHVDSEGHLLRSSRDGVAAHPAVLDDYACFVRGLIDLIAVRPTKARCAAAVRLEAQTRERFLGEDGRFVGTLSKDVPVADRRSEDGARPAAAAVAAMNALRMSELRRDEAAGKAARRVAEAAVGAMTETPLATMSMLRLTERLLAGPVEVVLCGEPDDRRRELLEAALDESFLPDAVILRCGPGKDDPARAAFPKFAEGKGLVDGAPAVWVCFGTQCLVPITDPDELRRALRPAVDRESDNGSK